MSDWPSDRILSDRIVEEAARRIYESQQSRLSDQSTTAAKRVWRSQDVPAKFWDSYLEDARAALSLTSVVVQKIFPANDFTGNDSALWKNWHPTWYRPYYNKTVDGQYDIF